MRSIDHPSPERLALRRFIDEQRIECGLEPAFRKVTFDLRIDTTGFVAAMKKAARAAKLLTTALDRKPWDGDPVPTFDAVAADLGWQP